MTTSLLGQDQHFIDFTSHCEDINQYENIYRINNNINSICLNYNLLTIGVTAVLNCADADSGYFSFSGDSLFLYTSYSKTLKIINGDTTYISEEAECDCEFDIIFDIYGFKTIPTTIYFNGKPIEVINKKYKSQETTFQDNRKVLIFDQCGFQYSFKYNENNQLEKVYRKKGLKRQTLIIDKKGEVIEINTMKNDFYNIKSIKIE